MMFIFDKPLEQVTQDDLEALIESQTRESLYLDYKREMYGDSDKDKKEFLKDVSSFANACGGHILIGVAEEEQLPVEIVGIVNAERQAQAARSLCASCIQENIQGLKIVPVPLDSGKHVLAIEIPQSIRQPHMVSYKRHSSFWKRQDDHTFPMNMEDIRYLCIAGSQLMEKCEKALSKLQEELTTVDNRGVNVQLAILPFYLKDNNIDTTQEELRGKLQQYNDYSPSSASSRTFIDSVQYFMYGIEGLTYGENREDSRARVQIYHNGLIHIFYRQKWNLNRTHTENDPEYFIHGPILVDYLINLLRFAKDIYQYCKIGGPFRFYVGFAGLNLLKLYSENEPFEGLVISRPLDTKKVLMPYQELPNLERLSGFLCMSHSRFKFPLSHSHGL